MNKREGFTLIEWLSVLVILAILTVIAVPKILNVIEKSRESAALSSAKLYIDAVQKNNVISEVNDSNEIILDGTYNDINKLNVNVKGDKPTSGTLTIKNSKVTNAELCINKYLIVYENSKAIVKNNNCNLSDGAGGKSENKVYDNGQIIYFDPQTGTKCDSYSDSNSESGVKSGCMKWYAFLDEGKDSSELKLLLDHNTSENVAWNSGNGNIEPKYILEAGKRISEDTNGWVGNPRLITADEIASIVGNNSFNSETSTKIEGISFKEYGWIFDRTSTVCKNSGCFNNSDKSYFGYWTSSRAIGYSDSDYYAWSVDSEGRIVAYTAFTSSPGVRPVITIKKESLK